MHYSNMDFYEVFMEVFVNLLCSGNSCLATHKVDSFSYCMHDGSLSKYKK